jgi:hypothetical protein
VRIFISYRRDDTAGHAGRLLDTLRRLFPHPVFMDVEGIHGAQDFVAVIEREIGQSDVMIALIGRQWLGAADRNGAHRIDDPRDYVRREIELALSARKAIVPVLVGKASMPAAPRLPDSLRGLARFHAVELSDSRWASDVDGLIDLLRRRAWEAASKTRIGMGTTQVRAKVPVPVRPAADASGALLVGDRSILLSSPRHHRIWSIAIDEQRVLGAVRLARAPLWTPTAMTFSSPYLWVADPFGRAVWELKPDLGIHLVYQTPGHEDPAGNNDESAAIEEEGEDEGERWTVEYRRPALRDSRRFRIGSRVSDLALHRDSGVWVVVPETPRKEARWAVTLPELAPTRLVTAGELVRIHPAHRKVVARVPIPHPRRVAAGTDAVWVTALDVVARVDPKRNMVAQVVPLEFEPGAIAAGEDAVWAADQRLVARIDAPTGRFVGAVEVPEGFIGCLALGAGSLWACAHNMLYRIDTRSNTVVEAVDLSPTAGSRIMDIAISGTLVCVAVADTVFRETFVALLDTADADDGGNS